MKKWIPILATFAVFAILAVYKGAELPARFEYLTAAHQAGPVGVRDPIGAISPDGMWLAFISNRHLFLHRVEGASTTELLPANDTKTAITWFQDSLHLAVQETPFGATPRWFSYDVATAKREPIASPPAETGQAPPPPSITEKIRGSAVYSPDRRKFYYSIANAKGTLDLWSLNVESGEASQLTHFDRDTYAPSITSRGDVLFKSQLFNAVLGVAPAAGGPTRTLTTFQSETPTWSPDGKNIAFTFGPWRRVIDDALYPNISQDLGIIPFNEQSAAPKPASIFQDNPTEDQGMVWSPNGKWIVFHSHRDKTDDLYLQLADGSQPPRQITKGGTETGWPRWSPDGRWIVFGGYPGEFTSTRGKLYILGIDQNTGQITQPAAPIQIDGQVETAGEPNWLPDSEHLVFDSYGAVPGRHAVAEVSRKGGPSRKIMTYASDQIFSGISASPDGKWIAYVAMAPDGMYQIFRAPITGGLPRQVTTDPTNKTQPAFSPDGTCLAFTIWRYDLQFWMLRVGQ